MTEQNANPQPEISEDEKRFWAQLEVLGKITDCTQNIEDAEDEIAQLKEQLKDKKDFHKGESIRLKMLGAELKAIVEGKPLPENPHKPDEAEQAQQLAEGLPEAWKAQQTADLLKELPGLGKKKLEAICDLAPTAADLEKLRGEASLENLHFANKLPKGCGKALADAIEGRLVNLVAKHAPKSAADQAEVERLYQECSESIGKELQKLGADYNADDFKPESPDDEADPFAHGFKCHGESKPYTDCPADDEDDARQWMEGWVSADVVANWNGAPAEEGDDSQAEWVETEPAEDSEFATL